MSRSRLLALCLAAGLLTLAAGFLFAGRSEAAPGAASQATAARTFVSTTGSDANPCTNTQPCRNFAAAIAKTNAGGEVVALSSGGYGPFTIDKSVTVSAVGVYAGIT